MRELCKDPNADILYVTLLLGTTDHVVNTTYKGLWRVPNARTAAAQTVNGVGAGVVVPNTPAAALNIEGIAPVTHAGATVLYVAAQNAIYRVTSPGGAAVWTQLLAATAGEAPENICLFTTVAAWAGAASNGSQDVLLVGTNDQGTATVNGGRFQTVWRSLDGGATWESISGFSTLSHNVPTPSEEWYFHSQNPSLASISGGGHAVAYVDIDQTNPDRAYGAGRSGMWRIDNLTAPLIANVVVNPIARGYNAAVETQVGIDRFTPSRSSYVYFTDTDWNSFLSQWWGARNPDKTGSLSSNGHGGAAVHRHLRRRIRSLLHDGFRTRLQLRRQALHLT